MPRMAQVLTRELRQFWSSPPRAGVPQPAPDLRAGIAIPRSVRASEGYPQLFGKSAVSVARDLVYGGSLVSSESSG